MGGGGLGKYVCEEENVVFHGGSKLCYSIQVGNAECIMNTDDSRHSL